MVYPSPHDAMVNMGAVGLALGAALIVVVILLAVGVIPSPFGSSVATGPTGGQTTPNNTVPDSEVITYGATGTIVPPLPKLVKYIKVSKVMADEPAPDLKGFHVAEIKAFADDGSQLAQDAYSDVSYGAGLGARASGQIDYPAMNVNDGDLRTFATTGGTETDGPVPIHTLTMTIKNPIKIKRVEVYNRADYAPERMRGAFVSLLADDGSIIWTSGKLTADTTVQVLNPQYSEGFLPTSVKELFRR